MENTERTARESVKKLEEKVKQLSNDKINMTKSFEAKIQNLKDQVACKDKTILVHKSLVIKKEKEIDSVKDRMKKSQKTSKIECNNCEHFTQENKNLKNHDITDHQISDNRSRMTNSTNLVDKAAAAKIDEKDRELKRSIGKY